MAVALESHLRAAGAAMRAGNANEAGAIAERALAAGLEHPQLLIFAAYGRIGAGAFAQALPLAVRAVELAPHDLDALSAKAKCLRSLGRPAEALQAYAAAIDLAPDDAHLQFQYADSLESVGEIRRAIAAFEKAFALDPANADAATRAAFLCANSGAFAKARTLGLAALECDPGQIFASLAVALADAAGGHPIEAERRLREVLARPRIGRLARAQADGILGDVLDRMDKPQEAFAAYARAGEANRALFAPPQGAETAPMRLARIARFVEAMPARSAQASPVAAGRRHVFLVGFPRSGTSLMAQVLAAHPDVALLDEKQTLADCLPLMESDEGLARFAALDGAELERLRQAYWKRATGFGVDPAKAAVVDKVPLNCEILCLIAKLFPQAGIVFAIRDPRDVVFSCFRRRFGMTRQMYELLTLESAASYYDAVMRLSLLYSQRLDISILNLRHEDLVRDFDTETSRLCAFVGIGAAAALKDFALRAQDRDITTPSAAQVRKGLNADGVGRWRAYAPQMHGVMALLEPWVRRFGYADG